MTGIGDRVRQVRQARGWSQEALAVMVGKKQQNIQQLEDGVVERPRYLFELAKALDVSVDWLLTGTPSPRPPEGEGAEAPGAIPPEVWDHLPAEARALVQDIVDRSATGTLSEDDLRWLRSTAQHLSGRK